MSTKRLIFDRLAGPSSIRVPDIGSVTLAWGEGSRHEWLQLELLHHRPIPLYFRTYFSHPVISEDI